MPASSLGAINTKIVALVLIGRSGALLMSRVLGNAATPITQATLSSISLAVYDLDYGGIATYGPTALTISSVVFDSLQYDQPWIQAGGDGFGYNFKAVIPAQALSMAGKRMRADAKFTPVSGEAFVVQAEANLSPTYIP